MLENFPVNQQQKIPVPTNFWNVSVMKQMFYITVSPYYLRYKSVSLYLKQLKHAGTNFAVRRATYVRLWRASKTIFFKQETYRSYYELIIIIDSSRKTGN